MAEYDFQIEHGPGKELVVPDTLSRAPLPCTSAEIEALIVPPEEITTFFITAMGFDIPTHTSALVSQVFSPDFQCTALACDLSPPIFPVTHYLTLLRRGFGLRKIGQKNEKKYEKKRKPLPDATPNTRVIRGPTFLIFSLHAMIKILSLPVLNVSDHSGPSFANIAKLMHNAEPCLGDYQGYHRSKVLLLITIKALLRLASGMKKPSQFYFYQ